MTGLGYTQNRNNEPMGGRYLRRGLIGIVAFVLTISLATRTFRVDAPRMSTAHSVSSQATRQHMDRDAVQWTLPAAHQSSFDTVSFFSVTDAPPFLVSIQPSDNSLRNRPPPARFFS